MKNEKACADKNCPIHGTIRTRGRTFTGVVKSSKMQRTVTVEVERQQYIPKYQRYEKRRTRLKAHNPDCIDVKRGEAVRVLECRPISKTKNFVVIEKVNLNAGNKSKNTKKP